MSLGTIDLMPAVSVRLLHLQRLSEEDLSPGVTLSITILLSPVSNVVYVIIFILILNYVSSIV